MNIRDLEKFMIENGVAIRAIPMKITSIYEVSHSKEFPNGYVKYLEQFKREMLVVESVPINAGKFIIECNQGSNRSVSFNPNKFYDSIELAIKDILGVKEN